MMKSTSGLAAEAVFSAPASVGSSSHAAAKPNLRNSRTTLFILE
jgi:hypothetical protein